MNDLVDLDNLSAVLRKSVDIEIKSRVKTFFDVSGFPHYENVISNILAFFFDTNEEHGLKELWLKSLLDCYNERAGTSFQSGEVEEIEREHSTDERKRLDIIISMEDTVIAIENKIYATPYNPFNMYHEEILNYCNGGKQIVEILLSLNKEENQQTKYNTTFYNITYKNLIGKVKQNLGNYIVDANEKWLIFMKDVLNNIENLGARDSMNGEWQKFLKDNGEYISKFFDNYRKDIQTKLTFISDLSQKVNDKMSANNLKLSAETYHVKNSGSFTGYLSLYIDITKGEDIIVLEPYIMKNDPAYLVIALWNRKNKKYDYVEEISNLQDTFADIKVVDFSNWGKSLVLEKYDFEKELTLDVIAEKLLMIVNKIA
ncbi:MAG: PD-(D/E)XK nuclease family protein [Christensenellaceae bacterium]